MTEAGDAPGITQGHWRWPVAGAGGEEGLQACSEDLLVRGVHGFCFYILAFALQSDPQEAVKRRAAKEGMC